VETNESEAGGDLNAICYWCDNALLSKGYRRLSVCLNCQKLLRGAGLRDSEIFVEPDRERPAITAEKPPDEPPSTETPLQTTDHCPISAAD